MFGRKRTPSYTRGRQERYSSTGRRERSSHAGSAEAVKRLASGRRNQRKPQRESGQKSAFFGFDWLRVRLWSVAVLFALFTAVLWARAYDLQIIKGPEYAAKAKRQHTAREVVQGMRGNILDRNGNVIALSVDCSSVWANPAVVVDKEETAAKLAPVLGQSPAALVALLKDGKRFVWLQRKVDYSVAEKVRELKLPGIYLDTESERVYPYKHLAGQLLGFVDIDDKGIEGLEKSFEEELSGRRVTRVVERDAAGRRLMPADGGLFSDLRGKDIRLTLDTQVQFFAEEALQTNVDKYGARWGGCIVVDVPSGDVLAWAQYPFFDPNNAKGVPPALRRNRLASDMLEQGSTIKSFVIAAALEEKVVTPSTIINCEKGRWKVGRAILHDDTRSYDKLPVSKILHVSSNIGVAKIGMKLGAERYWSYLDRLGFGKPTPLPLAGQAKGILRPAHKWAEVDLATASFGQSFSATLAQMAQAYLCLASNGVQRPLNLVMRDVESCAIGLPTGGGTDAGVHMTTLETPEFTPEGDKIFSPETMVQVRDMLRDVVEEDGGTGRHARIAGLVVGGKTGTAQKADKSGRYGRGRVGTFVGMLPIENPRYLILVLLDEPTTVKYGGVIAAPVFRHVALNTMAYHGLLPDSDDPLVKEIARKEAERKAAEETRRLGRRGVAAAAEREKRRAETLRRSGEGVKVVRDMAATDVAEAVPGAVPSVVGMGMRSAVEVFQMEGVVPSFRGRGGVVVRQTPEAGSGWPDGPRECILWLEEDA